MHLKHLSLVNFKNISGAEMELGPKFNCFVGNNGAGKTTMLDAVHYLSVCKSFLNPLDGQNIKMEQPFLVISGIFSIDGDEEAVYCALKRDGKKRFKRNKKEYKRLADHIGRFPSVVVAPTDSDIINGGSEPRRRFLDTVISQLDRTYLDMLLRYNRGLRHRNALLKTFQQTRSYRAEDLDIWNVQMSESGQVIFDKRSEFLQDFIREFDQFYRTISGTEEKIGLTYLSQLNNGDMYSQMKIHTDRDRNAGFTTIGIHKDDLQLNINGLPLKKFGSQGQQKSALVALKLAQFIVMKKRSGRTPLLLLDDIFDKLDDDRVGQLLQLVGSQDFGQILITDTHPERVSQLLKAQKDVKVFTMKGGELQPS